MKDLSPQQLEALTKTAKEVMGDYRQLPIEDVLNRIHYITNRDYRKCIEGLKLMLQHHVIKATFVDGLDRLPQLEKTIDRAMPIINAFEAQIVKANVVASAPEVTGAVMQEVLDGPTDDAEERGDPSIDVGAPKDNPMFQLKARIMPDLSHINSNF